MGSNKDCMILIIDRRFTDLLIHGVHNTSNYSSPNAYRKVENGTELSIQYFSSLSIKYLIHLHIFSVSRLLTKKE